MDNASYYAKLPNVLSKEEQNKLLDELSSLKSLLKTNPHKEAQKKYFNIRETLISHNLRLCVVYAEQYCFKHNIQEQLDDVYSECVIALTDAIDNYKNSKSTALSTIAYAYMKNRLYNILRDTRYDALNKVVDNSIDNDTDDDEDEDTDLILLLADSANIQKEYAEDQFVKDIHNFINKKIKNEKHRQIINMYFGFGYNNPSTITEIAKKFNQSKTSIWAVIRQQKENIKKYISINYPQFLPAGTNKTTTNISQDKNRYYYESYYGLNNRKKKTLAQLSYESALPIYTIYDSIQKVKEEIINPDLQELNNIAKSNKYKYTDECLQNIINDYYGLNGATPLSSEEMLKKYNIKSSNNLACILKQAKERLNMINSDELNKIRKRIRTDKNLERAKICYDMYNGLNGYSKLTQSQIAELLSIHNSLVGKLIKDYKNYLLKICYDMYNGLNGYSKLTQSQIAETLNIPDNLVGKLIKHYQDNLCVGQSEN